MRLDLPTFLTPLSVIGVSKRRPRWTVYFMNGARFTQMWAAPNNIGYHPPEPHYFFGNVDEGPILEKQAEIWGKYGASNKGKEAYASFLCETYGADNVAQNKTVIPNRPRRNEPTEGKRLVEVKGRQGNLMGHCSGGALEPVTMGEASRVIAEINSRSTNIIQYEGTAYYCFE